jgi:hypothetical protein
VPWREIPVLHERTSVSPRAPEFAILCASRVNEVVLARGDEFDLANARLSIPAERMKVGKPRTVTLAKRAVGILRDLHPGAPNPDELVFGITGAALTKMLVLAGYGDATVHGTARASLKTWADECTGFKDAVSEACLAPSRATGSKQAYARGEFEEQRAELMEMRSRHCASPPSACMTDTTELTAIGSPRHRRTQRSRSPYAVVASRCSANRWSRRSLSGCWRDTSILRCRSGRAWRTSRGRCWQVCFNNAAAA